MSAPITTLVQARILAQLGALRTQIFLFYFAFVFFSLVSIGWFIYLIVHWSMFTNKMLSSWSTQIHASIFGIFLKLLPRSESFYLSGTMWCHTRRIPSSDETSHEFSQRKNSCCSWGDCARQKILPLLYSYLTWKNTLYHTLQYFSTIKKRMSIVLKLSGRWCQSMLKKTCPHAIVNWSGVTDD